MRKALQIGIPLLLLLGMGIGIWQWWDTVSSPAVTQRLYYDFGEHLPDAKVTTNDRQYVRVSNLSINGEVKPVIYAHPMSRITYTIQMPPEPLALQFSFGLDEAVWSPDKGDGVIFEITASTSQTSNNLFNQYIDPKQEIKDRRWFNKTIDLSTYKNQVLQLTFTTSAGPQGDARYDGSSWGAPQLIYLK